MIQLYMDYTCCVLIVNKKKISNATGTKKAGGRASFPAASRPHTRKTADPYPPT